GRRYGAEADFDYFQERMEIERDTFEIIELTWPLDGPGSKLDRIQRLEPDFRNGRMYLTKIPKDQEGRPISETANQRRMREQGEPFRILTPVKRADSDGNLYGLNQKFLEEYLVYPFSAHDDALDCASRWDDMEMWPPEIINPCDLEPECFVD